MEDHRIRHGASSPEDAWPPPATREALDGPHRGGARRPPTSDLLPSGHEPNTNGPVVMLAYATDRAKHDASYLRLALEVAARPGCPVPMLVCCSVASAFEKALVLRPKLIVIGESDAPEWHDEQIALCRHLKQQLPTGTPPAVVLLRDTNIPMEPAPAWTPTDGIASMLDRQSVLASLRRCLYGG